MAASLFLIIGLKINPQPSISREWHRGRIGVGEPNFKRPRTGPFAFGVQTELTMYGHDSLINHWTKDQFAPTSVRIICTVGKLGEPNSEKPLIEGLFFLVPKSRQRQ